MEEDSKKNREGFQYVTDFDSGYFRKKRGRGYTYLDADNNKIDKSEIITRIKSLGIPPAWENVWICDTTEGHIQAVGYDKKSRRQYIYNPSWREISEAQKFKRLKKLCWIYYKDKKQSL